MCHNVNSVNCFDFNQCFLHVEAPPHKLTTHVKRQTSSLQISQVWQTHLSSKHIDIFHLTQQFLYFTKDQNFCIPGGSFQDHYLAPSWRNMFENWSYLSYFPSLTQNINGNLKKESRAACLSTSGWEVSIFQHKWLNFLNTFGRLISTEPDVTCLLSMSRPVLHFIEQSALKPFQWHLTCISYFSVRHHRSTSMALMACIMNFCYFYVVKTLFFLKKT